MNIVIPMAGNGSRFKEAGYDLPKPLIDINGKPMIQLVVENLNIKEANYIFLVQSEHYKNYNLDVLLNKIKPNCQIIVIDRVTEGAACTTLMAKKYIDNDIPLLIANSDQYIEWDSEIFINDFSKYDAGIVTFKDNHPKWSYAKVDDFGYVSEVAEKQVISDQATVGIYYWTNGKEYVKYALQMIDKDIRVNNEFYVCPVFNEAILDNKKIIIKEVEKMYGLGTPADLQVFLQK